MRLAPTSDLWWKNAVVYCLDVETFPTPTATVRRLAGLIERIDHVADLGATCMWLMPLYPTPNQDDGYDITDYLGVDPRLGDLGDVAEAIRHATDRGLRVLADLVVNHTSIEHPWFQAARADRDVAVPRLLRVDRRPVDARRGRRRTTGRGTSEAGQLLHAPLRSPSSPTSNIANPAVRDADRQDRRLLAAARRLGLPHGRRPVPGRGASARDEAGSGEASAGCTRCASTRCAGAATRC